MHLRPEGKGRQQQQVAAGLVRLWRMMSMSKRGYAGLRVVSTQARRQRLDAMNWRNGYMAEISYQLSVSEGRVISEQRSAIRKQGKAYAENVGHTESTEERRKDFNTELTEGPRRERRQREVFSRRRRRKSREGVMKYGLAAGFAVAKAAASRRTPSWAGMAEGSGPPPRPGRGKRQAGPTKKRTRRGGEEEPRSTDKSVCAT